MTSPAGTVVFAWGFCAAARPAAWRVACAWANVEPEGIAGTVTGACPCEGTRVMVEP